MMNHFPSNAFSRAGADRTVFCGCGESFANHSAFKEHSLLDHHGQHIDGSSHFLSKFTLVVLPARTQNTKAYRQDGLFQDFSTEDNSDVHTKRIGKNQPEFIVESMQDQAEASKSSNAFGEIGIEKLALIWNGNTAHNYSYYCGNCRQRNFATATEFIIHLRDICPVFHKKSTHYLIDYEKQIQDYMRKTHKPKYNADAPTNKRFFIQLFGTNVDHSDLPVLCGPCKQAFNNLRNFLSHVERTHQGRIHQSSSHVILKFRSLALCFTDKLQWIHDEATAFCACEPSKKMTVANLIKHVRNVHHGISPLYTRELIKEVCGSTNCQQNASLQKTLAIKYTDTQHRQTDECQSLEEDESIEKRMQQTLQYSPSDKITEDIANLRLIRNPTAGSNHIFFCGNCQKKDFENAVSFIIHLKNICEEKHPKSSHYLIERNIQRQIEDFQQNEKHGPTGQKRLKSQNALLRAINITMDHSSLTFECGVCRQIFESNSYYLHILARHSEVIDRNSSHIILRFPWKTRNHVYVSDRVPWIHQEEAYFCPCKPDKKMTMERLIKHVREVHMGISPIYDFSVNNVNKSSQNESDHACKIFKNVSTFQRITKEQQLLEKNEFIEEKKMQMDNHESLKGAVQGDITLLRLVRCPGAGSNHIFYCGNCRRHDFNSPAQFITHLRDICEEKHPKSSHFLVEKDFRKEVEDYQKKKDHSLSKINQQSKKHAEFIQSFLGTNYDHSDLTFDCQTCRQIYKEGVYYFVHAQNRHQEIISSTSSHIILRFPSSNSIRRKHVYISDRVPWFNEDTRYYCPCKVDKKMTMNDLIKHVRQVHMGISPIYDLPTNYSSSIQGQSIQIPKIQKQASVSHPAAENLQMIENNPQIETTRMQQVFDKRGFDATQEEEDFAHLRLVRYPGASSNPIFLCGKCRRYDFNSPAQFITHLRDICKEKHEKSSHFLIEKDFRREVEDYQEKKDHPTATIKTLITKCNDFITSFLRATYDHSDLTFECYLCRQIFENGSAYYQHFRLKHSEKLHENSSHIILRFPSDVKFSDAKRKLVYITDRVPWINKDAIYYCPCEPNNKLTMKHLIKHVRQIHHGVSPIYQHEQGFLALTKPLISQNNASDQIVLADKTKIIEKIQKAPQIYRNDERTHRRPQQHFSLATSAIQEISLSNFRLTTNASYCCGGAYYYYCGVCRKNDFKDATNLISHILICSDNHPKSSHFLTSIDFKKEIQDYQTKKDHNAATIKNGNKQVEFITSFLGTTYDHSDLTFECYPCRHVFKEGRSYYHHAMFKHSSTLYFTSSHIILWFPSNHNSKRKAIYLSDRVPWVNNDERYYCPCEPHKNITMVSLIRHVKEVHKGISPRYEM